MSDLLLVGFAAIWRVPEQDVGEVLLLLGIGIPVAGLLGGAFSASYNEGINLIGRLLLSAAAIGILPFLTLSCSAITGASI